MSRWLDRLLGQKPKSASQAKDRLKLVLIHDRMDLTPDALEKLKNEMLQVISRYVDIVPEAVHIQMAHEGREQRLVADIPLRARAKR